MANKSNDNKKRTLLTLKEVFLFGENEMSMKYGLDSHTPKNVYIPDTTQNKVITHTEEEPLDECGCDGDMEDPNNGIISKSGAPGGPELGGGHGNVVGPSIPDMDPGSMPGGQIVLFDMDSDGSPYEETFESVYEGPSDQEDQEDQDNEYYDLQDMEQQDRDDDRYSSDWKPKVYESFGGVAGDDWLEIG